MNVTIFGATGATGKLLTERCLSAGYTVKILARDPRSFSLSGYVETIVGDAKDPDAVRQAVLGSDVVLSALGARSLRREDVLEDAVPLIVKAMQDYGVRRIIALGSAGALPNALDKQSGYRRWIIEKLVYKIVLKWPVASQRAQYKALSTSNLDWTMVMPPMLLNERARGNIRVDGEALPPGGSRIARADVADFMMQQIDGKDWIRKGVYICW
jgi:putative NADH-flavin reductase